jgi:UDP-glucose:(heptosyl)LPS alpha-1,3-glucosyltransferase
MKIGVIRQRYAASGGAERYLNEVIKALSARGHRVHVFANAWAGDAAVQCQFHRVPMLRGASFWRALSFAWWSKKIVARVGCDLVFSLERTLQQDVYRAGDGCHREWLAQRRKFVSGFKAASLALNPLHTTLLALEKQTFSPARTGWILANSRRGKEEIIRHYGFPAERIHVIYNGVDCTRFEPLPDPRSTGEFILLFVGTGFERKGLRFCVEVLSKLPRHVKLKVVGKGHPTPYRRLAKKLGVESRLEFLGFDLDLASVYRTANLLVHPAIYEPFANVCLEAMACGLPVATARINGASELIEPGRNGVIVERPNDIEGLAEAIRFFLDGKTWAAASQHARQTAEAHPFSAHVSQTLEILSLAKSKNVRAPVRDGF